MEKTCRLVHITYRENNRGPGREEYKNVITFPESFCEGTQRFVSGNSVIHSVDKVWFKRKVPVICRNESPCEITCASTEYCNFGISRHYCNIQGSRRGRRRGARRTRSKLICELLCEIQPPTQNESYEHAHSKNIYTIVSEKSWIKK